jgi:hypothetical protein
VVLFFIFISHSPRNRKTAAVRPEGYDTRTGTFSSRVCSSPVDLLTIIIAVTECIKMYAR